MSELFEACRNGDVEYIRSAYEKNPEVVNQKDERGFPLLVMAVYTGRKEVAEFLISHGADINGRDMAGNTPLMGSVFKGNKDMIAWLLQNGADVHARNYTMATALTFAAGYANGEVVKMLLEAGAEKGVEDNNGMKPIDHARKQQNEEAVAALEG
ncbi:ankyrin repeat domain-containing protein [Roseivirga sp. BDSF3-8]|uniref:ankyrin repeat domain-containing protein n=1 Tax=Roseivirga sp. BDSF3-8 TaxID=3241598 RepID=UPI003532240B